MQIWDEAEVPFSDFPDEEEYGPEESDPQEEDSVEQAKAVICNFGLYKGQTLGQMLETQKGWESLKWIASRYNGANREMKEAAAVLVQAAAYEAKAA